MPKIRLIKLRSAMAAQDPTLRDEAEAFLKELDPNGELTFTEEKDALPVFFVLTGGSEMYFHDLYARYDAPYFIMPLGIRNSFAASLEIQSFLKGLGLPTKFLYGDKKKMLETLKLYASAYAIKAHLKGKKIALIGGPSDWLISSQTEQKLIKSKLGVNLIKISTSELEREIDRHVILDEESFHAMRRRTRRDDALRGSFYIYSALTAVAKKHKLDGFSLRCFDLLKKYQNTSCLAFGFLNDRGILASCEGDIPSLLTMLVLKELTGEPSFMANPEKFDIAKQEAIYAHCTCPFSMVTSYRLMTHYESGMGFGIRGKFKESEVTMAKFSPNLDRFVVKEGKILANLEENDYCRSQIQVSFGEGISDLIENPAGNHMLFAYGSHKAILDAFFELLA